MKRSFRPKATPPDARYPTLTGLSERARRKLLTGIGAAVLSAGVAAGCSGLTGNDIVVSDGVPELPHVDAAGFSVDSGGIAPMPADAGEPDGGVIAEDASILGGEPPLPDDAGGP